MSGTATALAAATGPRTLLGDIGERLAHRVPETEFEQGLRRFSLLHAWRIEREHLHVDAGRVHLRDALVADILKLLAKLRSADVQLHLMKGAGHRLSEPRDIAAPLRAGDQLLARPI